MSKSIDRPAVRSIPRGFILGVLSAAVIVQVCFIGLALKTTGHVDGMAFRSVDGREFMNLAKNVAGHGRFSQDPQQPFRPDTWRCPGYPILLAACVRCFGDSPLAPVLLQQVLAVAGVLLVVRIASAWMSARRACLLGLLWAVEPYRGYYSLWLLSETWFVFLLVLAVFIWQSWYEQQGSLRRLMVVGMLVGLMVLTRPLAMALIPVLLGAALFVPGGLSRRCLRFVVCLAGLAILLVPWCLRNRVVAGRFAISHQGGVVLTYYKAVEVVLWHRGQTRQRYDPQTLHAVWEEFDERVRRRWSAEHGALTPQAAKDISWPQIAWGHVSQVNPLLLDRPIAQVGWEVLGEHPLSSLSCWLSRCGSILVFPLSLAIDPPDQPEALPFASLLPSASASARRLLAVLLAAPFALLTFLAGRAALRLICVRKWYGLTFFLLPSIAMLLATSPQTDPRFRLPIIPFLLILAAINAKPAEVPTST